MAGGNFWGVLHQPEQTTAHRIANGLDNFGTGLGSVLQSLATHKAQQVYDNKITQQLLGAGIPEQYAKLYPTLGPEGQKSFWNSFNFGNLIPGDQEEGNPNPWYKPYGNKSFDQELKREKFEQQKLEAAEKKQALINKTYQSRLDEYDKFDKVGQELENIAQEAYQLVNELEKEGKAVNPLVEGAIQGVNSLSRGTVNLGSLVGEKAERLRSLYSQLVTAKTALLKGQPSNFKVKLLQETKPSLTQSPAAQKALLENTLREAQSLRVPHQEALRILEENEGNLPQNFSQLISPAIEERQNQLYKSIRPTQVKEKDILQKLGSPSKAVEGKGKKDKDTGIIYFVKDNKWFQKG
jgi:hypothetical protein